MHPVTRAIIGAAKKLSAADAFKGLYALQEMKAKLAPAIASVDLICVPTAPRHYTVEEVLADPVGTNSRLGTYTNFVNLLDLCGIAVPAGIRDDGLPMGITLLAPAGKDGLAAALGEAVHGASGGTLGATGWPLPPAPARHPAADGTIELAVVGAHMSGMPLNGTLKELGAQFCRATRTAPAYRLYALAGQAIPKPGLVRSSHADGFSIEVEVWSLDAASFGRFVAEIPSPLGVGTLELEDGSQCKGFLAEACGVAGAKDISMHGGWRNYMMAGTAAA